MFFSKLLPSLRILFKEKRITLINILGLSISLASTLFMLLWVVDELSYDRFHEDHERLYRVEEDQYYSNPEPYHVNVTPWVSGPVWKAEVPEIEEQCRYAWAGGQLFTYEDKKFFEDHIVVTDSSFFDMFSFEFKYGNKADVLREPNTMVLTEEVATKYFGDENPVGQSILVNQEEVYTVTAVVEDPPRNTVVSFRVLMPWATAHSMGMYNDTWNSNSIRTFVKLQEGSVDSVANRKITEVTDIYKENNTIDFMVAPLTGIHLYSYFGFGHSPGAILYVYIFSAIALFVLLIACINFMNLSTARSSIRAREIGMRKVNGASRRILVTQYLGESLIQTLLSIILAFLLVLLLLDQFNQISGKLIRPGALFSIRFLLGTLVILVLTTFLAGLYPAAYLSGLRPVQAIREQSEGKRGSGLLRKILVVFQFSLAVLLITAALVSSRQLDYMRNADLGFEKNNLLHIELRGNLNEQYDMLREEFMKIPGIISTTASIQAPYRIGSNSSGITWEGKDPELDVLVSFTGVHYDFIKTMGITLTGGRDFSENHPADFMTDSTANFIINQTLADIIGQEEIVGMPLTFMGLSGQVVALMEDYHFKSLGNEIEPMALAPLPAAYLQHMVVRLDQANPSSALRSLEERWAELLPQYPFEYTYVDEAIAHMYNSETRLADLMRIFMLVAIVIACLGLFALASFSSQRRTREIGIRLTLGASPSQIILMMIRDFTWYIFIALLIALPAVWFIARRWLEEFHFRIDLEAGLFIVTALLTVAVAVLTVLYHAVKTSRTNPVEALWHE